MKKIFSIFLVTAVLVLACAKPPVEEMNKAMEALTRAENNADAVGYAGTTLNRAREALAKMQEESDSKRYDSAKIFAADVIDLSERAIAEGRTGAARAREEAANLLSSLRDPLAETEAALGAAKRTPNIQLDFNALDSNMDYAKSNYSSAQQSLSSSNYPDALAKGQTVRSALSSINGSLNAAAQAMSSKK